MSVFIPDTDGDVVKKKTRVLASEATLTRSQ
jgi:hypothetical protein